MSDFREAPANGTVSKSGRRDAVDYTPSCRIPMGKNDFLGARQPSSKAGGSHLGPKNSRISQRSSLMGGASNRRSGYRKASGTRTSATMSSGTRSGIRKSNRHAQKLPSALHVEDEELLRLVDVNLWKKAMEQQRLDGSAKSPTADLDSGFGPSGLNARTRGLLRKDNGGAAGGFSADLFGSLNKESQQTGLAVTGDVETSLSRAVFDTLQGLNASSKSPADDGSGADVSVDQGHQVTESDLQLALALGMVSSEISAGGSGNDDVGSSSILASESQMRLGLQRGGDHVGGPGLSGVLGGSDSDMGFDSKLEMAGRKMLDILRADSDLPTPDQLRNDAQLSSLIPQSAGLQDSICIDITETDTVEVLCIPSTRINGIRLNDRKFETERNEAYASLLHRHNTEPELFQDRFSETFHSSVRSKDVQAMPAMRASQGVQVSAWQIYDAFREYEAREEAQIKQQLQFGGASGGSDAVTGVIQDEDGMGSDDDPINASRISGGSSQHRSRMSSRMSSRMDRSRRGASASRSKRSTATGTSNTKRSGHGFRDLSRMSVDVLNSSRMRRSVAVMERAIVQNLRHWQQFLYLSHDPFPVIPSSMLSLNKHLDTANITDVSSVGLMRLAPSARILVNASLLEASHAALVRETESASGSSSAIDSSGFNSAGNNQEDGQLEDRMNEDGSGGPNNQNDAKAGSAGADDASNHADGSSGDSERVFVLNNPNLVTLWKLSCELTDELCVSCLDWNPANPNMLIAGYSSHDYSMRSDGLLLLWTLRNPFHPQQVFEAPCGVVSVAFSNAHPQLFAAGHVDGSVSIYDVRSRSRLPLVQSLPDCNSHREPVWGLRWVRPKESDRQEALYSVSTDGRVLSWNMKKGLIPQEVMTLKRVANEAQFQRIGVEGISREGSGMCIDFPLGDDSQYICGTEDGTIHLCSTSYNEQTLENYFCHTGPVFSVKCSPFHPGVFISCSADWRCALWSTNNGKPLVEFHVGNEFVTDVAWSQSNSCVWASCTDDGNIDIWDMTKSTLDPFIRFKRPGCKQTCLKFSPTAPVLAAGDDFGVITLYRIVGVDLFTSPTANVEEELLLGAKDTAARITMDSGNFASVEAALASSNHAEIASKLDSDEDVPVSQMEQVLALEAVILGLKRTQQVRRS